ALRPQDISPICRKLEEEIESTEIVPRETKRRFAHVSLSPRILASLLLLAAVITVIAVTSLRMPPSGTKRELGKKESLPSRLDTATGQMMLITEGEFLSGAPPVRVTLPSYYIAGFEVTNELYGKFCAETHKELPVGFAEAPKDFPVVNITIDEARQ